MSLSAVALIAMSAVVMNHGARVTAMFLPEAWSPTVGHMGVACGALVLVACSTLQGAS